MAPLNKGTLVIALQLIGMGWYVAVCIIGGLLGGVWLDRKLDVLPVFTLAGVVLGTVMAFYGIYKMVLPLLNNVQGIDKQNGER
ncbi:MAG: AtpZ/AtpI family protein [Dehalococcoidia bacterium]|nr:AtpZ/AtpI family protein [Dehalococcoidia bacterium]